MQAMITAISDSDKIWWTVNQNLDAFSPEGISMALTVAGRNRVKYVDTNVFPYQSKELVSTI